MSVDRTLPGRGYPRMLDLLELLVESEEPLTLGTLAERLRMPKSTAWILVQHLLDRGYVLDVGDRAFVLGPSLYRLSTAALHRHPLRHLARPHLVALRERIDANIYLAVRSGDDVVFLDRLEGSQMLQISAPLTEPRSLHSTAAGKLMLAMSDDGLLDRLVARREPLEAMTERTITDLGVLGREVRRTKRRGYALSDGEQYEGVFSIAAPVFGPTGSLVAAVVASDYAPTFRAQLEARTNAVCETAVAVSKLVA